MLQLSGDSGVALGLITALQFGPTLLLSMYGGVLADRYDKRRMLHDHPGADGRAGAGPRAPRRHRRRRALARLRAGRRPGRGRRPIDAPVRQAFVSEMVGPGAAGQRGQPELDDLQRRPAGRPGARRACSSARRRATPRPAFFVNAASFAFTIAALAGMRADELRPSPPVARAGGQLREGLAYTWAHPDLVLAMVLAFVIGTFGFNYQVTIALMAREVFDLGAEAFGLLSTVLRRRLADRRAAVHPAQRPAAAALPRRLGGRLRRAHRRRRADAGLRRRSPCCWCPPAPRRWSSAWPTTASSSSASTRRCAAGSWRSTSCASWAARRSARPLIGWISEHLGAPWGLILGGASCVVAGLVAAAASWPAAGGCGSRRGSPPPRLRLRVGRATAAVRRRAGCARPRRSWRERAPGQQVAGRLSRRPTGVPSRHPRPGREATWSPLAAADRRSPARASPAPASPGPARRCRWVARRRRRAPPARPPRTARRPLQVVAADLRRLGRQLALVPAGAPLARWQALLAPPTTTC